MKSDGSIWAWGSNLNGGLGDGTEIFRSTPVLIGTDFLSISSGNHHAAGIKADGSLWAWGNNTFGQVGDGTITPQFLPVRIGTGNNWASVSAGNTHTAAIRTDGSLWAWGNNSDGQLGDGTIVQRRAPVRIGTDNDWASVSSSSLYKMAIKTDGSLWAWGNHTTPMLTGGVMVISTTPVRIWPADFASEPEPCAVCKEQICECCAACKQHPCVCCPVCGERDCKCCAVCGQKNCACCAACKQHPCACAGDGPRPGCCIDYTGEDLIVPSIERPGEIFINLTAETITIPANYAVTQFRTDGGKWKNVKQSLSTRRFPRLLNKPIALQLTDGDTTVTFPRINKRPAAPRLAVNYHLVRDTTGATPGKWVLTERGGTTAVRNNIQIGGVTGKTADEKGQFFEDGGICVKPLAGTKPERTQYLIRTAPAQSGDTFTAASRVRRIRASGELRAPRYKEKKGEINIRAGTYVSLPDGTVTLHGERKKLPVVSGMRVWQGATAKRPASAKQTIPG
jgi:hypothetical protein